MDNPRAEKVAVVDEVRDRFERADAALLTDYRGLDVAAMQELRRALTAAGGDYKIYKNTLVRLAVSDFDYDIADLLVGPTAIAFVTGTEEAPADPASVAKAIRSFAKAQPALVLKGGVLDGKLLSASDALGLADLPSREQLFAELAGAMESILQDFAGLLDAKLSEFARAMEELADKGTLAAGESHTSGRRSGDDATSAADPDRGADESTDAEAAAGEPTSEGTADQAATETETETEEQES